MQAYERLLKYVAFPTASDGGSETCPSTDSQLVLGRALVSEMLEMGISDARIDSNGYVYGTVPANCDTAGLKTLGFVAHMDVVNDVPFENIKPRIVKNYDGKDILLNSEKNIVLSPDDFSSLKACVGHDLIVTDGTTLLGADNKAGIAEILTAAEYLMAHPEIKHGDFKIGFTPDEEIGRGADLFDIKGWGADCAYTVDGSDFGEVEYENFNAASAVVSFNGANIHPGSAKNKMKNSMIIAMEYNAMLPEMERPERTEGYEGFYHLTSMSGDVENARLRFILRDHDGEKLKIKKQTMQKIADYLNDKYGACIVTLEIKDSYQNMAEQIKPHWHLIDNAYEAVRMAGGKPFSNPVRGGTDGARLSYMGLPCPNIGTGGRNFHGKMEYASITEMNKCVEVIVNLAQIYGKK